MFCSVAARAVVSPFQSLLVAPKRDGERVGFLPKRHHRARRQSKGRSVLQAWVHEVDGLAREGQGLSTLVLVRGQRAPGSITHEQQTCGIVTSL